MSIKSKNNTNSINEKFLKLLIITISCIFISNLLYGQKVLKAYVLHNFHVVKSIDTSYNSFSDLKSLGKAIGSSRIVMLGEQDHGDAPTFLAKTRLIRYLHEKKGFNVLAFESDFFALTKGWEKLPKTKEKMIHFLENNIYFLWTKCEACSYLFYTYIPSTYNSDSPIHITGIDNQLLMKYSLSDFTTALNGLLDSKEFIGRINGIKRKKIVSMADSVLIAKRHGESLSKNKLDFLRANLQKIDSLFSSRKVNRGFWRMAIENLLSYINLTPDNRDRQMAKNLKWLATEAFPNQKIIVWAANGHIVRYTKKMSKQIGSRLGDRAPNQIFKNMGTDFAKNKSLESQTYVLGFTSATGKAGRLGRGTFKISPPKRNSFESWIPDSVQYGFVDFLLFNKHHPNYNKGFQLKGFTHMYYPRNFAWNRAFDGIFYIKEMYPCNRNRR